MRTFSVILTAFTLLVLIGACKDEAPDWIASEPGRSILDLEYINDTLGIRLRDIRSVQKGKDTYEISVYLQTESQERYLNGYHFYLHFYQEPGPEQDGGFMGTIAGAPHFKDKVLIFRGVLQSERESYPLLRYGLVDESKNRLFTLAVDTTDILLK